MITKFKQLFEDLTDIITNIENEKKEIIDKIKHELSIISYKRKNSPKPIRITEIYGYFNKRDFKNIKLIYRTYLVISMSNNDKIEATLSVFDNAKNINIKINSDLVYDLDNDNFNNEILADKIITKYKENLLKEYKKLRK